MPAPYDAVYMVIDRQLWTSPKPIINRYFYGADLTATPNATDLANEFAATLLPLICECQVDTLFHTSITVTNVSDVFDYYQLNINTPGDADLEGLPPASPVGFRSQQPGYGERGAAKRISGVPEAWAQNGIVNTTVGQLLQLAVALGTPLEGADGIYYPVVVTVPDPFVLPLASVPNNRDAIGWSIRQGNSTQTTRRT